MTEPTFDEVKSTIKEINTGKGPGLDGIPVELLRYGGDNIAAAVYTFSPGVWHGDHVPQDWVDASRVGSKSNGGDYRGISISCRKSLFRDPAEPTDKVIDLPSCHPRKPVWF